MRWECIPCHPVVIVHLLNWPSTALHCVSIYFNYTVLVQKICGSNWVPVECTISNTYKYCSLHKQYCSSIAAHIQQLRSTKHCECTVVGLGSKYITGNGLYIWLAHFSYYIRSWIYTYHNSLVCSTVLIVWVTALYTTRVLVLHIRYS